MQNWFDVTPDTDKVINRYILIDFSNQIEFNIYFLAP